MQNSAGRDVLAGEAIETDPVEPVPLAAPQQGMPPCAADFAAEATQSQQVRRDCMVREVAIQDPLKPPAQRPARVRAAVDRAFRGSQSTSLAYASWPSNERPGTFLVGRFHNNA